LSASSVVLIPADGEIGLQIILVSGRYVFSSTAWFTTSPRRVAGSDQLPPVVVAVAAAPADGNQHPDADGDEGETDYGNQQSYTFGTR
jgi:hypothetical protein